MDDPRTATCFYGLRARLLLALARRGLWRKLLNYALAETELRLGRGRLASRPYLLVIDPASACSLRCPFCPTGRGKGTRPKAVLGWEDYVRVMDRLGPALLRAEFYNWGEPTLNPRLWDMVAYAKRYSVETYLSSHFNDLGPAGAAGLLDSGLDFLVLSLDGATQGAYERYRAGGSLEKALGNVRALVRERSRRGLKRPFIVWKFLVFRHNEHELAAAAELCRSVGADAFLPAPAVIPDPAWLPVREGARFYPEAGAGGSSLLNREGARRRGSGRPACVWPWLAAVVNADGSVSPCCGVEDRADDFGEAFSSPPAELFNNAAFRAARAFLASGAAPAGRNVCAACPHAGRINPFIPPWWGSGSVGGVTLEELLLPRPAPAGRILV